MSSTVEQLLEEIRQFAVEELGPIAKLYDNDELYPRELVEKVLQRDVLYLLLEDNRFDGSFKDFLRVIRIISKHFAALGSILLTQGACGVLPLYQFGTELQKAKYLNDILSGEKMVSFAVNEEESGSYIENIRTTAKRVEDGWVISGQKVFISNAPIADVMIIAAKISHCETSNPSIGFFIVDSQTEGISVGTPEQKMGIKALPVAKISLEDVKVDEDALLGGEVNGLEQFEWIMNRQRLAIASQSIGIAQGAMERGIKYVTYDRRFGQRLIDLQNTQMKLAEAQTKIDATRAFLLRVEDEFIDDTRKVSMAKLIASEVSIETTETILQVTGGYAYMRNNEIERFVRDAKVTAIYGGSSTTQKTIISMPWVKKNREE